MEILKNKQMCPMLTIVGQELGQSAGRTWAPDYTHLCTPKNPQISSRHFHFP